MGFCEATLIQKERFSFLLTLAPSNCSISNYINLLKEHKIKTVIQRTIISFIFDCDVVFVMCFCSLWFEPGC
jgi:hypothetical protein